jgi:hypothetical protein
VLFILDVLRVRANAQVKERSYFLRSRWEEGKEMGLLAAVQEELPTRWVIDAVAEVERRAREGDRPGVRRRARALLKKINKARDAVGGGNTKHLTPEEEPLSKRRAVSRTKAIARLAANYARWRGKGYDHEDALRQTEEKFTESKHIQDVHPKKLVLQGFRNRIHELRENLP